jgi:hypothetical protein
MRFFVPDVLKIMALAVFAASLAGCPLLPPQFQAVIEVTPAETTIDVGKTVDFNATSTDVTVQCSGSATDSGGSPVTGTDLQWQYRRQGSANWIGAGTGASVTMELQDDSCTATGYDIRLRATDSAGNTGEAIIQVSVTGFYC